eukprot:139062-Prorocentrum_lima.AAC.1
MKQPTLEASVARAFESMERQMAMLEPSSNDLSELKGRVLSLALEMEELQLLIEERKQGGYD